MTEKECAIPMCGGDSKLVPICPNGHFMHVECLKGIATHQEEPHCPVCRDPYLSEMKSMFEENPFIYQPPSPGPAPGPFEFEGGIPPQQLMNQLLARAYMPPRRVMPLRPRMVTTTRTLQSMPMQGGVMRVETVQRTHGAPPLFRAVPRQRPHYHLPRQAP